MCGFAGLITKNNSSQKTDLIKKMMKAIEHRGSLSPSYYYHNNVGLGHCSLEIVDKETVMQPITYQNSGIFLMFDGTIYNNKELRQDLIGKGYIFSTNSMPETVLLSYIEYGKDFLEKLNGMWALAIYNKNDQSFFLARDRFGGKPLYFYAESNYFAFASEYKSFLAISDLLNMDLDMQAFYTAIYNKSSILEASGKSLFKNIHSILPGHSISIKNNNIISSQWLDLNKSSIDIPNKYTDQCELFFELLKQSCRKIKDPNVPAALLLSNGLDSSTLAKIFEKQFKNNICNFFIPEKHNDVQPLNENILLNNFDDKKVVITFDKKDLLENIENIIFYTENIQFIPTYNNYFIHKKIKEAGYDISIAGHGADELLGGYFWHLSDFINTYNLQKKTYAKLFERFDQYNKFLASVSAISFIKSNYPFYSFQPLKLPSSFSLYKKNLAIGIYQSGGPYGNKLFETICSANKTECRSPYLDNQLVSYALMLPDKTNFTPNNNKKILLDINTLFLKRKYYYQHKNGFLNLSDSLFMDLDEWIKNIIYSNEYNLEIIDKKEFCSFYKNKIKKNNYTIFEGIIFWRTINALKLSNIFLNFRSKIN